MNVVVDMIAELFGLPTQQMYDELYNDYAELLKKYEELSKEAYRSKTPYIKVENNIFKYFNKYIVRTVCDKKKYSKSFNTIEEARTYLQEVKNGKQRRKTE